MQPIWRIKQLRNCRFCKEIFIVLYSRMAAFLQTCKGSIPINHTSITLLRKYHSAVDTGWCSLKPGFHIIVRIAPIVSKCVKTIGTILWKHCRDEPGRSQAIRTTRTIAIAWIEKILSGRSGRSRTIRKVLMETTFRRSGR